MIDGGHGHIIGTGDERGERGASFSGRTLQATPLPPAGYVHCISNIWSCQQIYGQIGYNGQYSRGPDSVPKISIRFRYMVNHLQGKILLDKTKEITVNLISDMQCTVRMCTALYRHDRRTD